MEMAHHHYHTVIKPLLPHHELSFEERAQAACEMLGGATTPGRMIGLLELLQRITECGRNDIDVNDVVHNGRYWIYGPEDKEPKNGRFVGGIPIFDKPLDEGMSPELHGYYERFRSWKLVAHHLLRHHKNERVNWFDVYQQILYIVKNSGNALREGQEECQGDDHETTPWHKQGHPDKAAGVQDDHHAGPSGRVGSMAATAQKAAKKKEGGGCGGVNGKMRAKAAGASRAIMDNKSAAADEFAFRVLYDGSNYQRASTTSAIADDQKEDKKSHTQTERQDAAAVAQDDVAHGEDDAHAAGEEEEEGGAAGESESEKKRGHSSDTHGDDKGKKRAKTAPATEMVGEEKQSGDRDDFIEAVELALVHKAMKLDDAWEREQWMEVYTAIRCKEPAFMKTLEQMMSASIDPYEAAYWLVQVHGPLAQQYNHHMDDK